MWHQQDQAKPTWSPNENKKCMSLCTSKGWFIFTLVEKDFNYILHFLTQLNRFNQNSALSFLFSVNLFSFDSICRSTVTFLKSHCHVLKKSLSSVIPFFRFHQMHNKLCFEKKHVFARMVVSYSTAYIRKSLTAYCYVVRWWCAEYLVKLVQLLAPLTLDYGLRQSTLYTVNNIPSWWKAPRYPQDVFSFLRTKSLCKWLSNFNIQDQ